MQPTKQLPAGYIARVTFDLSKSKGAQVILNVVGLILFIVFGWLFIWAASIILPAQSGFNGTIRFTSLPVILSFLLGIFVGLILITCVVLVLHELVHGFFYWLFTRQRPIFGFKGLYA